MSWGLRNSFCHNRCLPNRQDMSRNRQRGCTFRHSCNCSFFCIANHICRTGIELDTAKKSIKKEILVLDIMASGIKDSGFWNQKSDNVSFFQNISCNFSSFSCIANHICRTGIELDTAKKSIKKEMLVLDIMVDKLKDLGIWSLESRLFC